MRSLILRGLALMLVPVVLLATSVEARAEMRYGDPASAQFQYCISVVLNQACGPLGATDVSCSLDAFWRTDGTGQWVDVRNFRCNLGYALVNKRITTVQFKGTTDDGTDCSGSTSQWETSSGSTAAGTPVDVTRTLRTTVSVSPWYCSVGTVCMTTTDPDAPDSNQWECQDIEVGGPESAPPTPLCSTAGIVVTKPFIKEIVRSGAGTVWYEQIWVARVEFTITNTGSSARSFRPYTVSTNASHGYFAYRGYSASDAGSLAPTLVPGDFPIRVHSTGNGGVSVAGGSTSTVTVDYGLGPSFDARSGVYPPAPTPGPLTLGYGLYETTGKNLSDNNIMLGIQSKDGTYPANPAPMVGLSDPSRCSFYWGRRIAKVPIPYVTDQPIDGLGTYEPGTPDEPELPPVEEPDDELPDNESCNFSIKNPSTWLNGGMCAAVGLLGAIWRTLGDLTKAILGLAGQLIEGIGELFETLFIPSSDSFDVQGIKDQAGTRPPFSVVESLGTSVGSMGSGFASGNSGCSSPIDLNDPDLGPTGGAVSCSKVTGVPGYGGLYSLVQIGLWALTAWGLFIVGSKSLRGGA